MSVFKKTFLVVILPLAGWFVSNSIYQIIFMERWSFLNLPLMGYLALLILIMATATPALLWSEKIYPKYFKKFNEAYSNQWNTGKSVVILSVIISFLIISLTFRQCGYAGSNSCRGVIGAIQMFYTHYLVENPGNHIFAPQKGLSTVGTFLGLMASSTLVLKELIPRTVFYWKRRNQ